VKTPDAVKSVETLGAGKKNLVKIVEKRGAEVEM
jgi:hypothetical protein